MHVEGLFVIIPSQMHMNHIIARGFVKLLKVAKLSETHYICVFSLSPLRTSSNRQRRIALLVLMSCRILRVTSGPMCWKRASRNWSRKRRSGRRKRIQLPLKLPRCGPSLTIQQLTTNLWPFSELRSLTVIAWQGTQGDSKNAKKKNNKKTNKNKSSMSRANKKKPGMPNVANDLSQKLYATMEKHKEVQPIFSVCNRNWNSCFEINEIQSKCSCFWNLLCCRCSLWSTSTLGPWPIRCHPLLTLTLCSLVTWWMAAMPSWLSPGTNTGSSAHSEGASGAPCACSSSCTTRARTALCIHAMSANTTWRHGGTALCARYLISLLLFVLSFNLYF